MILNGASHYRTSHRMIPQLIQRRGAVHVADEEAEVARDAGLVAPLAIVELIPEAVARENVIFPLTLDGETLTLAAVVPNDILLADKLSFILNKRVRLVRYPREQIVKAINRHYGVAESESVDSLLCEITDTSIALEDRDTVLWRKAGAIPQV